MLEAVGIIVSYGDTRAVNGVDLRVERGEVVCVLGPSGCGKTSLLRVIAGLTAPDQGSVAWEGEDLTAVPTHKREFGLMFQDHALFPHRSVEGNVAFGLRMAKLPRTEVASRSREVLELVGLSGFGERSIAELSGGEQQRVALARALAPRPRLLMLDEPLGALDRILRDRLMVELRELFGELGTTVLYVTHDQTEALVVSDRLAIMREGRLEQVGPSVDVWRRPATAFVADFLGHRNVIERDGRQVVVRPEAFHPDESGEIRGVITARSYRGDHWLASVATQDGLVLLVELGWEPLPDVGDELTLRIDQAGVLPIGP